ncbi:MAG TPA: hypothetical protein VIH52_01845 [Candidatus Nanoarchaeia archaeon]|nr:hypothetical protein [uncultured archaeon]
MAKAWFGVHKFWGWYPITWEAYLLIALMFFGVGFSVFTADLNSHSVSDTLTTAFPFASLIVSVTILVTSLKGVRPKFGKKTSANYSSDNPKAYLVLPFLVLPVIIYYFASGGYLGAGLLFMVFLTLLGVYRNLQKRS